MSVSFVLMAAAAIAPVSADFDGDGVADRAWLRETATGHEIVVDRSAGGTTVVEAVRNPRHLYLTVLAPGTYASACGKGLGPRTAPCSERFVTLAGPALAFGDEHASQAVALWDGERFRVVWLSD